MRASDLLIYPSLYEGLPVTLVESQAMGLESLIADNITHEVEVVQGMVHRLPLDVGPEIWSEQAVRLLTSGSLDAEVCLRKVEESPFNIRNSAKDLMRLYTS
jgi:glycosyltransferase involved in cell wall biosynthesis